jgi:hypothetical protein
VNDKFLDDVRSGKCVYVRGDTMRLTQNGVLVNVREWIQHGAPFGIGGGVREQDIEDGHGDTNASGNNIWEAKRPTEQKKTQPHNAPHLEEIKADLIVLATGYKRPDIDFLPHELFPEGYEASDPPFMCIPRA